MSEELLENYDDVEISAKKLKRKFPKAASCYREVHAVREEEKKHIIKWYVKLKVEGVKDWAGAFSVIGFFAGIFLGMTVNRDRDLSDLQYIAMIVGCTLLPIGLYFLYKLILWSKAKKFDFHHVQEVILAESMVAGSTEIMEVWVWDEQENNFYWWPCTPCRVTGAKPGDVLYLLQEGKVCIPKDIKIMPKAGR